MDNLSMNAEINQKEALRNIETGKKNQINFGRRKNKFERNPKEDSFENKKAKPKKHNLKKFFIGLGAALTAGFGIFLLVKSKKNNNGTSTTETNSTSSDSKNRISKGDEPIEDTSKIDELQKEIEKRNAALEQQKKELELQQQKNRELSDTIEDLLQTDKKQEQAEAKYTEQYEKLIENPTLSYDPLNAPVEKPFERFSCVDTVYNLDEIKPFEKDTEAKEALDPNVYKDILLQQGRVDLQVPKKGEVNPAISKDSFIGDKQIDILNRTVPTDIATAYGKRINWSEEKIARDIMQNFYDGQGHTLDGVNINIEKLENGKTKVKITGDGMYNYENLEVFGSGTKEENPYNAGGFGEGSKILVANMLGKKDADKITYSCADWKLSFTDSNGRIQKNLQKTDDIIQGNSIEFETENGKLVDAILNSVNYFQHGTNPDFQNTSYDSKDFSFTILDPKEKGNLYLTQRFEYEENNNWDNSLDGITIAFKRKPDPKKYKEITGEDLPKDRDRTFLTENDIKNLTHYFAHDMKDEDILKSIVSAKNMWSANYKMKSNKAVSGFLEGMIKEAKSRRLKIDCKDEKYAAKNRYCREVIMEHLINYGFTILPEEFDNLGFKTTVDAFKELSMHKPLQPTEVEIKKLKLLEEGLRIIQLNLTQELQRKLENPNIEIKNDANIENLVSRFDAYIKQDIIENKNTKLQTLLNLTDEEVQDSFSFDRCEKYKEIPEENFDEIRIELEKIINSNLKQHSKKLDLDSLNRLLNCLICEKKGLECKSTEYLNHLCNYQLILPEDVEKPRYIFDRKSEIAHNTLGESIVESDYKKHFGREYKGHWVDREYLNSADFSEMLSTWIHEVCHKSGGDGTSEFTYALTDMITSIIDAKNSSSSSARLSALANIFNQLDNEEDIAA